MELYVTCFIWNGSESCPIDKCLYDDNYFGYEYGDRCWFITNVETEENLWFSDLLPVQCGQWGFFHSPSSEYRLNPDKYIKFFNISDSSPILELPTKNVHMWISNGYSMCKNKKKVIILTINAWPGYKTCIYLNDDDIIYKKTQNIII